MATSTPRRRSLVRHRPNLGQVTLNAASPPNIATNLTTTPRPPSSSTLVFTRKASANLSTPGSLSTIPDSSISYGLTPTHDAGSSPLTMYPITPAPARHINGDKFGNMDLEVGDTVDVPGGMHGIVKFIGEVKGKKGIFAGVELSREWAARGKNDGDVEGIRYFTTSVPGAGIFLPSSKAFKRISPPVDSLSLTPTTPSLAAFNLGGRAEGNAYTPPTPSVSKLSQSVGPGRPTSPSLRPKSRPSLPRPESPLRKTQNMIATPAGRPSLGAPKFTKNSISTPRYAPSPTPGKFGSSLRTAKDSASTEISKRSAQVYKPDARTQARPTSRSQSRLGPEPMFDEESEATPTGIAKASFGIQAPKRGSRPLSDQDDEIQRLKAKLEERDKQLKEQTLSLAEMENSLIELQSAMPNHLSGEPSRGSRGSGIDDADAVQLRIMLREKNEKIAALTADFDAHRADFRSTIDTLELASTETERVYERKVEDLMQEIRELQDRGDDMESVAQQLKQLEELVQELEEGLEDARRGEAEARGEVEFLRGEVERGRSELRREREKAAAALKGAGTVIGGGMANGSLREVEQRDDEIRGLKAIIHSLSRDAVPDLGSSNGIRRLSKQRNNDTGLANGHEDDQLADERHVREILEREVKELEGLVDRKTYREEELEHEIERLRKTVNATNKHTSSVSNGASERTIMPGQRNSGRDSKGVMNDWREQSALENHRQQHHLESMAEADAHSTVTDGSNLWCEICETGGHDILTCTNMFVDSSHHNGNTQASPKPSPDSQRTGRDVVIEGLKNLNASSSPSQPRENGHSPSPCPVPINGYHNAPNLTPNRHVMTDGEMVAGKASGIIDETRWCALCEKDGHESVDCPFEDAY